MVDNQVSHRANFRKQLAAGQIIDNSRNRHRSGAVSLPKPPARPPANVNPPDDRELTLAERLGIADIPRVNDLAPIPTLEPQMSAEAIPADVWSVPSLTSAPAAEQTVTGYEDSGLYMDKTGDAITPDEVGDEVIEASDMPPQQFTSTPSSEPNAFADMWNESSEITESSDEDEDPLV